MLVAAYAGKPRPKARWDIWALLNVGIVTLIYGIPQINRPIILTGGTLIFIAAALLVIQLYRSAYPRQQLGVFVIRLRRADHRHLPELRRACPGLAAQHQLDIRSNVGRVRGLDSGSMARSTYPHRSRRVAGDGGHCTVAVEYVSAAGTSRCRYGHAGSPPSPPRLGKHCQPNIAKPSRPQDRGPGGRHLVLARLRHLHDHTA